MMRLRHLSYATVLLCAMPLFLFAQNTKPWPYPIVDTGQKHIFNNRAQLFSIPRQGQNDFGQDGQYTSNPPHYQDNHDGTITDLVTGLMWEKAIHENKTFQQAQGMASSIHTGGHNDWRLPTIKELYSLMDFNGTVTTSKPVPYIDTNYFDFKWGNESNKNNRIIDAQFFTSTQYVGSTMGGNPTVFGVNFADGRIKGYPRERMSRFVRYVRGNPDYGKNLFVDNNDGTISDMATGLMWAKADSQRTMDWENALKYAENLNTAGHNDWRLPNAKELQSIVDYTRAPDARDASQRSAAIDPIFNITKTESYFWTSTTHYDGPAYDHAVYVAFGQALGYFAPPHSNQSKQWMNVHGAGAQRSDPKSGDPSRFSTGHGPQGDDIRIYNYARAVRNINPDEVTIVTPSTDRLPAMSVTRDMFNPNARGPQNQQGTGNQPGDAIRRPPMGRMPPPR